LRLALLRDDRIDDVEGSLAGLRTGNGSVLENVAIDAVRAEGAELALPRRRALGRRRPPVSRSLIAAVGKSLFAETATPPQG